MVILMELFTAHWYFIQQLRIIAKVGSNYFDGKVDGYCVNWLENQRNPIYYANLEQEHFDQYAHFTFNGIHENWNGSRKNWNVQIFYGVYKISQNRLEVDQQDFSM